MLWIWRFLLFLSLNIFICYCCEFDRWCQKRVFFYLHLHGTEKGGKRERNKNEVMFTYSHIVREYLYLFSVLQWWFFLFFNLLLLVTLPSFSFSGKLRSFGARWNRIVGGFSQKKIIEKIDLDTFCAWIYLLLLFCQKIHALLFVRLQCSFVSSFFLPFSPSFFRSVVY